MSDTLLKIRMLGELTLTLDKHTISEDQNRTRKMWTLMAYLLYNRGRVVTQEELLELLWNNTERHNPVSAMKTAMHRTRALMDDLAPGIGHDLILKKSGGYTWNTNYPMELDIDRFEQLCQLQEDSEDHLLKQWLRALDLYHGNFLSRMSSELWVIPVAAYYQNLYVKTALKVLPLLEQRGEIDQAVQLALSFVGYPYVYGGSSPKGFDCSGLTSYVYKQFGISLNRTCSGQLDNGTPVSMSELMPGDLVIFKKYANSSQRASHVGLYIGNGQFVHASTYGVGVIVSKMTDAYYTTGFVGGRRVV